MTFDCYDYVYLIVENADGATFLIIYTIFSFSFSLLIWNIFYRLPKSYGLIKKRRIDIVNVDEDMKVELNKTDSQVEEILNFN